MATTVTRTIRSSGGDYTSLSAWEAAQQGDLTGVRDEIAVAECYAMQDTTAVTVDGWTTSATQYIKITVPTAERHSGVWDTSKYRLVVSVNADVLTCNEDFFRAEGLQVHNTSMAANPSGIVGFTAVAGSTHYYSHCICRGSAGASSTSRGINIRANTTYLWNCLAYDWTGGGTSAGIRLNGNSGFTIYCYNCTAHSNDRGFEHPDSGASMIVKNCLAAGNTVSFHAGWNWPAGSNYNACDTALTTTGNGGMNNPPGANSRHTQTFTFVNAAGDDFHLASSDAGAKDFGTDLSADPNLAFSDDVDGQTRSGSWDIGFDEFVAAGGTTVAPGAIGSGEAFGAARISQQIRSAAIGSGEAFGAHRLNLQIRPSALSSAEVFGSARVNLILRATGLASAESFGAHLVTSGNLIIQPTSLGSTEGFGAGRLNQQIRAQAIASLEAFGTARMVLFLRPPGIGSGEAFGLPVLVPGPVTIVVTGIAGGEAIGAPVLVLVAGQTPREMFTATGRVFLIDAAGRVFTIEATARPFTFNA